MIILFIEVNMFSYTMPQSKEISEEQVHLRMAQKKQN